MTAVSLVVPIDIAALCVGTPDLEDEAATTLAPLADFSLLPYAAGGKVHNRGPYISAVACANGAAFAGTMPLARGIHLHWALPDGLTHGVQSSDEDAKIEFPAVPNRWLVTRIVMAPAGTNQAPTATLRSWVVESDRLSKTATTPPGLIGPTVPMSPSPGQSFRYLGQAFDLQTWSEDGTAERLSPLTAVGYGEPSFAALYPNSSTVFGLLDTLADLAGHTTAHLAYHVAGWYSSPAADPLSSGDAGAVAERMQWSWSAAATPTATVCSGVADNLSWDPERAYLAADSAAKPLSVAIGNTAADGLSALMASVLPPKRFGRVEMLLDALQFGLLSRRGEVDVLASLDDALHRAGTASSPGGTLWAVSPANLGSTDDASQRPPAPAGIAHALDALNVAQGALDELLEELRSRREQLFVDWWKFLLVKYDSSEVPDELHGQLGEVQANLDAQADAISAIRKVGGRLATLEHDVDTLASGVRTALPAGLALTADTAAARYHGPVDPVVLLSGPDAVAPARYGGDGAGSTDGRLPCRVDGEVVTAATLAAGLVSGSAQVQIATAALGTLAAQPPGAPSALVQALLREALLLAPSLQPLVATAVAAAGGSANPATLDRESTVAALTTAARAFLAGTPSSAVHYAGSAPDALMVNSWSGTPWLPILLDYEVEFSPVLTVRAGTGAAAYPPDFVNAAFVLAPDTTDLAYTGAAPTPPQPYTGRTILSPAAAVDLVDEARRFLDGTGVADAELESIITELGSMPVLAQRLGGTLDAMLMRALMLQLRVADPLASPPDRRLITKVADAVAGESMLAPLPQNSFNPIRAGALVVRRLRLIDVFGRAKDYDSPATVVARPLQPRDGLLPAHSAFLPPRLAQPARLSFRWLAAADDSIETNEDPASSPIAGWVLPIWLDRAIALYEADGTPVGELALSADETRVLWTPAPGGPFAPETSIGTALTGCTPPLREFALTAYGNGKADFLAPFMAAIRSALTFALPAAFRESAELAVLMGQPLVLARAGLRLDIAGPPAADESWTSFTARVLDGAPADDAGLAAVRFPVRLGALARLNDTLVGYWLDAGGGPDYATFHALGATHEQGGVGPPAQDTLTLTAGSVQQPVTKATLLLDPRGCVNATSGILPVTSISIPPAHYRAALRAILPTLQTRPVLTGSAGAAIALALPKTSAGRWSWIAVDGDRWTETAATDAPATAGLGETPQRIAEGWLRLSRDDDDTTEA